MKVSGISFIKNGITLGYPFLESILSIEPLCDEVIINVGFEDPECTKDDGTYEYLKSKLTDSKYIFLKSWWDPEVSSQGLILSQQTNIALEKASGDIIQYIQGDEAIHESDFPAIRSGYQQLLDRDDIQGLVFNYLHLYGNTNVHRHTRSVYRREVRAIKNNCGLVSWKDAQGFRYPDGSKMKAILTTARIFHYGWARPQNVMDQKIKSFNKLYHGKDHQTENEFSFRRIWGLKSFNGTHPKVVLPWIQENTHDIDILNFPKSYILGDWDLMVSDFVEKLTDWRIGEFKNYRLVK